MLNRTHRRRVCSARRLATLAKMRAARERIRQERVAAGWIPEPRMERWYPLELGLRDKETGEVAWVDFKGLVSRRINDMKQYKLYWKSRTVCVDRGGNMRAPRYETEWYLSEHP